MIFQAKFYGDYKILLCARELIRLQIAHIGLAQKFRNFVKLRLKSNNRSLNNSK